jgi:hypothetical protein
MIDPNGMEATTNSPEFAVIINNAWNATKHGTDMHFEVKGNWEKKEDKEKENSEKSNDNQGVVAKGTLEINISRNNNLSSETANVWDASLSFVSEKGERTFLQVNGHNQFYLFGSALYDKFDDNDLQDKSVYTLRYDHMKNHPEWENNIRVTEDGVFIHNGYYPDLSGFQGCKGVGTTYEKIYDSLYFGDWKATLSSIRASYEEFESRLIGEKFILMNVKELPKPSPQIPQSINPFGFIKN